MRFSRDLNLMHRIVVFLSGLWKFNYVHDDKFKEGPLVSAQNLVRSWPIFHASCSMLQIIIINVQEGKKRNKTTRCTICNASVNCNEKRFFLFHLVIKFIQVGLKFDISLYILHKGASIICKDWATFFLYPT